MKTGQVGFVFKVNTRPYFNYIMIAYLKCKSQLIIKGEDNKCTLPAFFLTFNTHPILEHDQCLKIKAILSQI